MHCTKKSSSPTKLFFQLNFLEMTYPTYHPEMKAARQKNRQFVKTNVLGVFMA